jgi:RNA 2',3'-cyclic 3'-phosphodiesterase
MRLFIAIDINSENEYLNSIKSKLIDDNRIKAKFVDTYHITLKFLGEVNESRLKWILDRLSKIKFEPFTLEFDKIGFFPDEENINVIWLGLMGNIKVLQKKIEEALGLYDKDYHSHITLARVKSISDTKNVIGDISKMEIPSVKHEVNEFKLFKSTLTSSGPVYEELASFKA